MTPLSWMRRQARWKRITVLMLVLYAAVVPLNLLVRLAMHDWQWHPDALSSSLIMGLIGPALVLVQASMAKRPRD
ncbi:hypothetical protein [Actinophytocola sp.]|uniref:hypothetical protein n=1 Tax=Actinophytocola sp. TaxID=1872138 RepID=UPI002ECFD347